MQPKQFSIRPDGYKEVQRKCLLYYSFMILFSFMIVVAIVHFTLSKNPNDLTPLYLFSPVIFALAGFVAYKSFKRQKELFESFTLFVDDNSIKREQKDAPVISISHSDVKQIIRYRDGCISIKSNQSLSPIMIPAQIENIGELQETLREIHPIVEKTSINSNYWLSGMLTFITWTFTAWIFLTDNELVVSLCGSFIILAYVWSIYAIWKSKNYDQKAKESLIWFFVILFIIICRLMVVVLKK